MKDRGPGFWESLKELLPGHRRKLDCVQVEVTSRCNGRCGYCPHTVFAGNWRAQDMTVETFRNIWPLMRRAERVHLQGWGEPLLQADFFTFAALARKAGCAVSTTTCGLGLTEETAAALVEAELDIVAFSLTGTDAAGNRARAGIPFDTVCRSVEQLQTLRRARNAVYMEIHFAYLLLASNMTAVRGLPKLMRRLGVHAAVISTLDFIPHPTLSTEAILPADVEKKSAAEAILAETAAEARLLDLQFDYALPSREAPKHACHENIDRTLFVSADGTISPCVFRNIPTARSNHRLLIFGNVNRQDPLSVWESPEYAVFRRNMVSGKVDHICSGCAKRR